MRGFLTRLAVATALVAAASALPEHVAAAEPVEVYAIMATTGVAGFFGSAEARALDVVEKVVNASGGIKGRPVKFVVLDDQSNPQVTVQLMNQLVAKNVPAVLGPSVPQSCFAAGPIAERSRIVEMCLNPAGRPTLGGYQFVPFPNSVDVAAATLRYFVNHGLTRVALMNATDGSGQDATQAFKTALQLPEFRGITKVAEESYAPTDVSVSAQVTRIKAAGAQAVVSWNAGLPLGTVLRSMNDAGLDIPVVTSGGNMTYAQMQQYASFLPKDLLFGGMLAWVPGDVGPGPLRDQQMAYVAALRAEGLRSEAGYAGVWDPAFLLVDALRHLGPDATSDQIRAWLGQLHGWTGTDGVFDFHSYPQRGVGIDTVLIMRWDPAAKAFVAASKRGGRA
jgi:branched-chain amino acid transport system substrate-binding protein